MINLAGSKRGTLLWEAQKKNYVLVENNGESAHEWAVFSMGCDNALWCVSMSTHGSRAQYALFLIAVCRKATN